MSAAAHSDPTVWETIFASPVVIAAARVVILSAAVVLLIGGLYIAVSVVYRMRQGQWLRRAGPFEAHLAEEAREGLEVGGPLLKLYREALEQNELLTARVAEGDREFRELSSTMQTEHFRQHPDRAWKESVIWTRLRSRFRRSCRKA